jgi:Protein of unknown function (DUF1549)/Protein of unknown function (DUF1553)
MVLGLSREVMMPMLRRGLAMVVALTLGAAGLLMSVRAEDWLTPTTERPIAEVVDHYVDLRLAKEAVPAAPEADDATLVRRLTLDLVGRIPTAAEARAYVDATDPDKRAALVDRLMATPGFARHQAEAFDALLMTGVKGSLREYLVRAFGAGRTWDEVFRALLVADEAEPDRKGTAEFVKARAKDLDRLTSDVSSIFFGVNVSCSKCHDHPRVRDWKQDQFYGMKSFLGRTFMNGKFLGEHDYGVVTFKTTAGVERQAQFLFLNGRAVEMPGLAEPPAEERKEEKRRLAEAKAKNEPPPPPKSSARARLVEVALEPEARDFFARAIVNRLWHRYYGIGLVMPLDQMHSENRPSHPELLGWLARDLIEHRYDLRRLIRGLVLSQAYSRSSRWEPEPKSAERTAEASPTTTTAEAPDPRLFAVAAVRPLSPMQLATSMWVATTDPASIADVASPEALDPKVAAFEDRARGLATAIARPGEDYQIGASEALLLSNGGALGDLLADSGDRLVGRLAGIADRRRQIELAVRNVLSRDPDPEEVALLDAYLAERADRPVEGCRQLLWSLLTSSEFRFNH